ncbi:unnamed protein product [marine sediment metagenome]|uniref:Methionyl/Valyl/Leucyl/Isoleucyl-tRNA synthetase anticodon-binding domain-containing protein n=1 Tax=marine sediment metagenome TaxID=412755 RepID=X1R634_9ZZZZ
MIDLFFDFSDLTKYKDEGGLKDIFNECREKLTLLLHPIAPHTTEEIWELLGKKEFISLANWPSYNGSLLTVENEFKWKLMGNTVDDISSIKLATKKDKLKHISIIIAASWKFKFYSLLMSLIEKSKNQGEIMKKIMQHDEFKIYAKFINQTTAKILKNIGKYPKYTLSSEEEYQFFKEMIPIIKKKFNCPINIVLESNSEENKASQSLPGRPAIVIK